MAAPFFSATGAQANNQNAITPGMGAGVIVGDFLLLVLETSAAAITVSGGTETWTEVVGSPVTGAAGTRLTCFWARASQVAPTSPTTSDSGDHQHGRIIVYRGVGGVGADAINITGSNVQTSGTAGSITGVTTTVNNCMIVHFSVSDLPDAAGSAEYGTLTNASLTSINDRVDNSIATGDGGALAIWEGVLATAGASGTSTFTKANAGVMAHLVVALSGATSLPYQSNIPTRARL